MALAGLVCIGSPASSAAQHKDPLDFFALDEKADSEPELKPEDWAFKPITPPSMEPTAKPTLEPGRYSGKSRFEEEEEERKQLEAQKDPGRELREHFADMNAGIVKATATAKAPSVFERRPQDMRIEPQDRGAPSEFGSELPEKDDSLVPEREDSLVPQRESDSNAGNDASRDISW